MSCEPEKVSGFVDGVLAETDREALRGHMEQCRNCSGQAEAELALRARLREVEPVALPETTTARVRRSVRPSHRLRHWLAVAAVLLVALFARGNPAVLAWELARDHEHCFAKDPLPAQVWSSEASVVDAWFRERGTDLPQLPEAAGELRLVGARYCPLPGLTYAPHLYYASQDQVLSVFVVPRSVRFDPPFEALARGRGVRLLRVAGSVVGVVGEREADLDALVRALVRLRANATVATSGLAG